MKILYLSSPNSASGWFRIKQFANEIDRQGLATTYMIDGSEDSMKFKLLVKAADIIVGQYNTKQVIVETVKDLNPKAKLVVDFDDNVLAVGYDNPSYADWGTDDIQIKKQDSDELIDVWIGGKTEGFNVEANRDRVEQVKNISRIADVVTCVSHKLVDFMGQYAKKTAFVPNVVNTNLMYDVKVSDFHPEFRIFWQGSAIHKNEFNHVLPQLKKYITNDSNAHLYLRGAGNRAWSRAFGKRLHYMPFVQFQAVIPTLQLSNMDCAIIPLRDNEFNSYKSESKWLEMAAAGLPTVVEHTSPYARYIDEGVTGMSFVGSLELVAGIKKLQGDRVTRHRMGKNAQEWVRENRSLKKWTKLVVKFYENLSNG